ncbi:MAG: PD40 domain-containing protein [Bacteroidetes bacterium]|nr:PD40 domain-containing protein [Bacteroidota bacterium]MBL7105731.1 PD40 domain-containing protein [Bacteroidales bacterium]
MKIEKIKYIIISFFFVSAFLNISAQELSTKSKKARKAYINGEEFLRLHNYFQAEKQFLNAVDEDPGFYEAYMLLGEIYEQTKKDTDAVVVYRKAVAINPDRFPGAFFLLANIEYKNGWYKDALEHYIAFLEYPKIHNENRVNSEKRLQNCEFAMESMANPVLFDPVNLGENINSERDEYFPCITADNQTLLFTRLLQDSRSYTGRQEDFFISHYKDSAWQLAYNIGEPINTIQNEGAPSLSADGNILIFTACESLNGYGMNRKGFGRCDLFASKRMGNKWSVPYNLEKPVNSRQWESQPSFSSDGKTLYFVSNRHDNYDIWVSVVNESGEWSEPEKLGTNINTDDYEGSVFIHPDNQTLYFSSDGHVGMGGLDIYVSKKDSTGKWGKPVNLGYPINTYKDENSILISADGELAMFASDREGGFGGLDLYGFELYEEVRPEKVTYIKGIVFDNETGKKLEARFELIDLATGNIAVTSFSNKGTGEFLVCLPANHDYALNVSKEGYLFYSENFNLSGENPSTDPVLKDVPLKPLKAGEKVILKNIFFETDKYNLKKSSEIELQKLIELLNKNPEIKIEIGGHTDNVGTTEYNFELSQNRAKAVYDYLVKNKIDSDMLTYKGYGESQPVDTNDTEEGRANNRRTEFKVVE